MHNERSDRVTISFENRLRPRTRVRPVLSRVLFQGSDALFRICATPHRRPIGGASESPSMALPARKSGLRQALLRVLEAKHLDHDRHELSVLKNRGSGPALYTVIAYDAVRLALADELTPILAGKHQGDGGVWVLDEHDVSAICKR